MTGDIIILHFCTTNDDHVMYGSWDIEYNRQNFLSFQAIFLPFYPLAAKKMKISKQWKKYLEISSFYTSVPKIMIICYTVPEIWHATDVIVFFYILGYFLPFYSCNSLKNENFKKIKKFLEISLFHTCVPKIMIRWCTVREISCTTDKRMERVTYRGECPT